jgi:hypothetical protein
MSLAPSLNGTVSLSGIAGSWLEATPAWRRFECSVAKSLYLLVPDTTARQRR